MDAKVKLYLTQVEQWLDDCPRRGRAKLLNGLEEELEDYIREMPELVLTDGMEKVFGPPEEVAEQLLEASRLKNQVLKRRSRWIGEFVVFAILCTIIVIMGCWIWIHSHHYAVIRTYESEPIQISNEEFEKYFGEEP